jgi:hypothetical protein
MADESTSHDPGFALGFGRAIAIEWRVAVANGGGYGAKWVVGQP